MKQSESAISSPAAWKAVALPGAVSGRTEREAPFPDELHAAPRFPFTEHVFVRALSRAQSFRPAPPRR